MPKRKSAFRKTYFPHKELSLITIMEHLQIMLKTYHLQDRNADNLLFSPKTYDFPLNMKSMQKALQNYLSLINDKISRVFGEKLSLRNELSLPKMYGRFLR